VIVSDRSDVQPYSAVDVSWSVAGMESSALDASSAAASAALSRRRKQSRPRQLASSVDSENSADNQQGTDDSLMAACYNLCRKYFCIRINNILPSQCSVELKKTYE